MADYVHFHEALAENARVRAAAKRAVAELGFPFDEIYLETAAALARLELPAGLANAGMTPRPGK